VRNAHLELKRNYFMVINVMFSEKCGSRFAFQDDVNQIQPSFSVEVKKKFNVKYVVTVGVVVAMVAVVVFLMFVVVPFVNNNASLNSLVLSGLYVDPRGASIDFTGENTATIITPMSASTSAVDDFGMVSIYDMETIPSTSEGDLDLKAVFSVTYTLDGNQITFYIDTANRSDDLTLPFGYGTVSNNGQNIEYYGDVYTKRGLLPDFY